MSFRRSIATEKSILTIMDFSAKASKWHNKNNYLINGISNQFSMIVLSSIQSKTVHRNIVA